MIPRNISTYFKISQHIPNDLRGFQKGPRSGILCFCLMSTFDVFNIVILDHIISYYIILSKGHEGLQNGRRSGALLDSTFDVFNIWTF
jgi:hypothetical protein